jgi:hypothetical protein
MTKLSSAVGLCLATWSFGCGGPPRIDTASEESAAASLKEVRASLPETLRPAFDEALATLLSSGLDGDVGREMADGPREFGARVLEPLNGMTADEVLTEAQRVVAERERMRSAGPGESTTTPP